MATPAHLIKLRHTSEGFLDKKRFNTPVFAFDTLGDQLELSVEKDAADGLIDVTIREVEGVDLQRLTMQIDVSHIDDIIHTLQLLKLAAELKG